MGQQGRSQWRTYQRRDGSWARVYVQETDVDPPPQHYLPPEPRRIEYPFPRMHHYRHHPGEVWWAAFLLTVGALAGFLITHRLGVVCM
jgi:hypothetical protein